MAPVSLLFARYNVVADPDMQGAGARVGGQVERALQRIDCKGAEDVGSRVLKPGAVQHRIFILFYSHDSHKKDTNKGHILSAHWLELHPLQPVFILPCDGSS